MCIFLVECDGWFGYVQPADCLDKVLVNNNWASEDELQGKGDTDKRNKLMEQLYYHLDKSFHTFVELGDRQTSSDKGGLCGMGALYQALENTVLTKENDAA